MIISTSKKILPYFFLIVAIYFTFDLFHSYQSTFDNPPERRHVGILISINFSILLVGVFSFLTFKNIYNLVLERRNKLLGAKLKTKLVTSFLLLSLVPTGLLLYVSKGIINEVFESWFSPQVSEAVEGAIDISDIYYNYQVDTLKRYSKILQDRATQKLTEYSKGVTIDEISNKSKILEDLKNEFDNKQIEYDLESIYIIDSEGEYMLPFSKTATDELDPNLFDETSSEIRVIKSSSGGLDIITSFAYLGSFVFGTEDSAGAKNYESRGCYLIATMRLVPGVNEKISNILAAYDWYKIRQADQKPFASSYFITLLSVAILIVFLASWIGFKLAEGLTIPIRKLADGTQQLASGNLGHRIEYMADDELSLLVKSFNSMSSDLQLAASELVDRRKYMEIIFDNVEVGIVSINENLEIESFNSRAGEILGSEVPEAKSKFESVFPHVVSQEIKDLLGVLKENQKASKKVSTIIKGVYKHIQIDVTSINQKNKRTIIILLNDLTNLVNVQKLAAWQEVARRIAHEIKNPLTPILLSCQRIQKKAKQLEHENNQFYIDSSKTIENQVKAMRKLVDEFSKFAKMPSSMPKDADLNAILAESLSLFKHSYSEIKLIQNLKNDLPLLQLDSVQIQQVIVNLMENAKDSIIARVQEDPTITGYIEVKTSFDPGVRIVTLEIMDNGSGVSEEDKELLFQPYFSSKKSGTGLGLAIVQNIISDHKAFIRIKNLDLNWAKSHDAYKDGKTFGTSFVIEFPVR